MKSKDEQRQAPAMAGDRAEERPGKRTQDLGPAVNAAAGQKRGTIASQTKTTRRLDRTVKQNADEQMAGRKQADAKKGGRK